MVCLMNQSVPTNAREKRKVNKLKQTAALTAAVMPDIIPTRAYQQVSGTWYAAIYVATVFFSSSLKRRIKKDSHSCRMENSIHLLPCPRAIWKWYIQDWAQPGLVDTLLVPQILLAFSIVY